MDCQYLWILIPVCDIYDCNEYKFKYSILLTFTFSLPHYDYTEEYYCPVSDSEGMRYLLHTSLEMPHIMEFGSVADLNKEILIEVHPDMTNADDDIRLIEHV